MKLPMISDKSSSPTLYPSPLYVVVGAGFIYSSAHIPNKPQRIPNRKLERMEREWRTYSSFSTRSLICDSNESSVVEQTFICATLGFLLLLLFLDFWSL